MNIETRLSNLENLVNSLAETIIRNQFYNDADTAGARQSINETQQSIADITPYEATETVYYGETEKTFYNVPSGNITVFWDNYAGDYVIQRLDDTVTVSFDAIEVAEATISIMVQ